MGHSIKSSQEKAIDAWPTPCDFYALQKEKKNNNNKKIRKEKKRDAWNKEGRQQQRKKRSVLVVHYSLGFTAYKAASGGDFFRCGTPKDAVYKDYKAKTLGPKIRTSEDPTEW